MTIINKFGFGGNCPIIVSIDFGSAELKTTYYDTRKHEMDLNLFNVSIYNTACLYNSKTEPVAFGEQASKNRNMSNHIYIDDFKRELQRIAKKSTSEYTQDDRFTIKASADLLRFSVDYVTHSIKNTGLDSASDNSDHCYVLSLSLSNNDLVRQIVLQSGIVNQNDWDNRLLLADECFTALQYFNDSNFLTLNPSKAGSVSVICDLGAGGIELCAYEDQPGGDYYYMGQKEVFRASCEGNASLKLRDNIKEYLLGKMFGEQKHVAKEKYAAEMIAIMNSSYNNHHLKDFGNEEDDIVQFWIPPDLYDIPELCCQDQFVKINNSFVTKQGGKELQISVQELRQSSFDPLAKDIAHFLKGQFEEIRKSYKIDSVIMIGGLILSQYIYDLVCIMFKNEGLPVPFRVAKKPILSCNVVESLYGGICYAYELYRKNQSLPNIQYIDSWQNKPNIKSVISSNEFNILIYMDIGCIKSHVYYTISKKNQGSNVWSDEKISVVGEIPTKLLFNQSAKDLIDLPIFKAKNEPVKNVVIPPQATGKREKLRSSVKSVFGKIKKTPASSRESIISEKHPSDILSKQDIFKNHYTDDLVWGLSASQFDEASIMLHVDIDEFKNACALFLGCLNEHICSQIQVSNKQRQDFAYCIAVDDLFDPITKIEWRDAIITSGIANNEEDFYKRICLVKRGEALALQNATPEWNKNLDGVYNDRSTSFATAHVYQNACHVSTNDTYIAKDNTLAVIYRVGHADNALNILLGASVYFWELCQTSTVPYVHQCDAHSNGTVIINESLCDEVKEGFIKYLLLESTSLDLQDDEKVHKFDICRSGSCYATITSPDLLEHVIRPDMDLLAQIIIANLTVNDKIRTDISELQIYTNTTFFSKEPDYHIVCQELIKCVSMRTGSSKMQVVVKKLETDEPQQVLTGMNMFVSQSSKRIVDVMMDRTYAVRLVSPNAKIYHLVDGKKKLIKDSSELSLMIEKGTRTTFDSRRFGIQKQYFTSLNENQFVVEFYCSTSIHNKKKLAAKDKEFTKFHVCRFQYDQKQDWDFPIEVMIYPNVGSIECTVYYGGNDQSTPSFKYNENIQFSTFSD